jgi:hypothetical protein
LGVLFKKWTTSAYRLESALEYVLISADTPATLSLKKRAGRLRSQAIPCFSMCSVGNIPDDLLMKS